MLKICLACCVIFLTIFVCHQKVLPHWVLLKAGENPVFNSITNEEDIEKIQKIFQKPLKFLGHGSQCFAFVSENDDYVVKICRASRYRTFFTSKGKKKKESDFLSYFFAFHYLPQQSQVVFLHLNETQNLNSTLEIIDPLGFSYFLEADKLAFYIQKKAIPLPDYLKDLSTSESRLLARNLLDLFISCCQEGLQFQDIYPKNIGIYNGSPLWIDPGRIKQKPSLKGKESQKKALNQFFSLLNPFLEPLSPDFSALLEEELQVSF